jgi:hypothetical protein
MFKTVAVEVANSNFARPLKVVENRIKELLVGMGYSLESPENADVVLIVSAQEGCIDWIGRVFDDKKLSVGVTHNIFSQNRHTAHGFECFYYGRSGYSSGGWPDFCGHHYESGWFERGVVACFDEAVKWAAEIKEDREWAIEARSHLK